MPNRIKTKKCERCGREINHIGRCLPCNYLYKHKAWFPGLRESDNYDSDHGMDVEVVKKLIAEKRFSSQNKPKPTPKTKIDITSTGHRKCLRCATKVKGKYLYCLECYRFIKKYAHIKSYKEFLEIFDLDDSIESKDNYIEFVDDMNKFFDLQDFSIEGLLDNPREYLDKLQPKDTKN